MFVVATIVGEREKGESVPWKNKNLQSRDCYIGVVGGRGRLPKRQGCTRRVRPKTTTRETKRKTVDEAHQL